MTLLTFCDWIGTAALLALMGMLVLRLLPWAPGREFAKKWTRPTIVVFIYAGLAFEWVSLNDCGGATSYDWAAFVIVAMLPMLLLLPRGLSGDGSPGVSIRNAVSERVDI